MKNTPQIHLNVEDHRFEFQTEIIRCILHCGDDVICYVNSEKKQRTKESPPKKKIRCTFLSSATDWSQWANNWGEV